MELRQQTKQLPAAPGVYMMLDSRQNIIYIGKAKNLKNRVAQYFQQSAKSPKIAEMVEQISAVNYITTDTELDALIEECRLIKQVKPPYNRLLKSSRNYWYIKITDEIYPRLLVVKEKTDDCSIYYGPYSSSYRVENALDYLKSTYRIGICKGTRSAKKKGGCLYHALGECLGVCTGKVNPDIYAEHVEVIKKLLSGQDSVKVLRNLQNNLQDAVKNLHYEKAARIRDYYLGMRHIIQKQHLLRSMRGRRNVIAIEVMDDRNIKLFLIKGSTILHREKICLENINADELQNYCRQLLEMFKGNRSKSAFELAQPKPDSLVFQSSTTSLDEAQIIYSYLKNSDSILRFTLPSKSKRRVTTQHHDIVIEIMTKVQNYVKNR